jgi:hypothetical protein
MEGLTGSAMEGVHGGSIGSASVALPVKRGGQGGLDGEQPSRDRGARWGAAMEGSRGSMGGGGRKGSTGSI